MSMSLLRIIATFAERPPDVNEEQHLKLVETALQMFGTSGGFACLIAHAEAQGFEGTVNSWQVGSYQPIKADEVSTLIGQDRLERMANQSGLSVASTSQDLRGILPLLVDKLSLRGQMPKGE
jgi:uncharacterized protein YidB (DUF937 family)